MSKEENLEKSDVKRIMKTLPLQEINHMRRVSALVSILTARLGESCPTHAQKEDFPFYGQAASYHDIGKAWISKAILTKPEALTVQEFAAIKLHPFYAREFFSRIKIGLFTGIPEHLLLLTSNSAVYHHEWWNGMGYPFGISQENIPLIARVTSVCDAYDTITNERYYHAACSHETACCELEKNAGTQFDPEIAEVFLQYQGETRILINRLFPQNIHPEEYIQKGAEHV